LLPGERERAGAGPGVRRQARVRELPRGVRLPGLGPPRRRVGRSLGRYDPRRAPPPAPEAAARPTRLALGHPTDAARPPCSAPPGGGTSAGTEPESAPILIPRRPTATYLCAMADLPTTVRSPEGGLVDHASRALGAVFITVALLGVCWVLEVVNYGGDLTRQ